MHRFSSEFGKQQHHQGCVVQLLIRRHSHTASSSSTVDGGPLPIAVHTQLKSICDEIVRLSTTAVAHQGYSGSGSDGPLPHHRINSSNTHSQRLIHRKQKLHKARRSQQPTNNITTTTTTTIHLSSSSRRPASSHRRNHVSMIPWWLSASSQYSDDVCAVNDTYKAIPLATVPTSYIEEVASHAGNTPELISMTRRPHSVPLPTTSSIGEVDTTEGGTSEATTTTAIHHPDEELSTSLQVVLHRMREGVCQYQTDMDTLFTSSSSSSSTHPHALVVVPALNVGATSQLDKGSIIPTLSSTSEMFVDLLSEDTPFLITHHSIVTSFSVLFLFRFRLLLDAAAAVLDARRTASLATQLSPGLATVDNAMLSFPMSEVRSLIPSGMVPSDADDEGAWAKRVVLWDKHPPIPTLPQDTICSSSPSTPPPRQSEDDDTIPLDNAAVISSSSLVLPQYDNHVDTAPHLKGPVYDGVRTLSPEERVLLAARTAPFRGSPEVRVLYSDEQGFLLHRNMQAAVASTWGLAGKGVAPQQLTETNTTAGGQRKTLNLEEEANVQTAPHQTPYEATAGNVVRELRGLLDRDEAAEEDISSDSRKGLFDTRRASDSVLNIYTLHPLDFTALFKRSGARYTEYHNKCALAASNVSGGSNSPSSMLSSDVRDGAVRRIHDTVYPYSSLVRRRPFNPNTTDASTVQSTTAANDTTTAIPAGKGGAFTVPSTPFYMPPSPYTNLPARMTNVAFIPYIHALVDLDRSTHGQMEGWARSYGASNQGSPSSSAAFAWSHIARRLRKTLTSQWPKAAELASMYKESFNQLNGKAVLQSLPWQQIHALSVPKDLVRRGLNNVVYNDDTTTTAKDNGDAITTPPSGASSALPTMMLHDAANRTSYYRPRLYTWLPRRWRDTGVGDINVVPLYVRHQYASLYSKDLLPDPSAKNRCVIELEIMRKYLEQGFDSCVYAVPKYLYNRDDDEDGARGHARMDLYMRLSEVNLSPTSFQFPHMPISYNVPATQEAIFTYSRFRVTHLNGAPIAYWTSLATSAMREHLINFLVKLSTDPKGGESSSPPQRGKYSGSLADGDAQGGVSDVVKMIESEQISLALFDMYSRTHISRSWSSAEKSMSQAALTNQIKLQRLLLRLRSHYLPFITTGELSKLIGVLRVVIEEESTDIMSPPKPPIRNALEIATQSSFLSITAAFFPLHALAAIPADIVPPRGLARKHYNTAANTILQHVQKCLNSSKSLPSSSESSTFFDTTTPKPNATASEIIKYANQLREVSGEKGLSCSSVADEEWAPSMGSLIPHSMTFPRAYVNGVNPTTNKEEVRLGVTARDASRTARCQFKETEELHWVASTTPNLIISFPPNYPFAKRLQAFQCILEIRQLTRDLLIGSASSIVSTALARSISDVPYESPNAGFDELTDVLCDDAVKAGRHMSEAADGIRTLRTGRGARETFAYHKLNANGGNDNAADRPQKHPFYPHSNYIHIRVEAEGHCDEMGETISESLQQTKQAVLNLKQHTVAATNFSGFTPVEKLDTIVHDDVSFPPLLPQISPGAYAAAVNYIATIDAASIASDTATTMRLGTLPALPAPSIVAACSTTAPSPAIINTLSSTSLSSSRSPPSFQWSFPIRPYDIRRILQRSPSVLSTLFISRTPLFLDTHLCRPLASLARELPSPTYRLQYISKFPAFTRGRSAATGRKGPYLEVKANATNTTLNNSGGSNTPLLRTVSPPQPPRSIPFASLWMEAVIPTFFMRPARTAMMDTLMDVADVVKELTLTTPPPPSTTTTIPTTTTPSEASTTTRPTQQLPPGWFKGVSLNFWDGWGEMEDDTQSAKPFLLTTVTVSAFKRTDGKTLRLSSSTPQQRGDPTDLQHFTGRALPPMVAIVSLHAILRHHTSHKRMNLQLNALRVKRYLQWFSKYSSRLESSSVLSGSNLTGVLPSLHTEVNKNGLKAMDDVFQALLPPNAKAPTRGNVSTDTAVKYFYIPHSGSSGGDEPYSNTTPVKESDKAALDAFLSKFEEVMDSDIPAPPNGLLFPANTMEQLPNTTLLSKFIHDVTGRTFDQITRGFMVEVHRVFPKAVVVVTGLPPTTEGSPSPTVVLHFMCVIETPCLIALLNDHLQREVTNDAPLPDSHRVNLLRHTATGRFYALLTPVHMHVLYALMLFRRWALEERCRRYSTGSSLRADQDDGPDQQGMHTLNSKSANPKHVPHLFDTDGGKLDMITPHQLQVDAVESGVEMVMSTTARTIAHTAVSTWRGKRSGKEGGGSSDLQLTAPTPLRQLGSSDVLDSDVHSADIVSTLLLNQPYASSTGSAITSSSSSLSSSIGAGFRAATTKALSDIGDRQTFTRNRLEGSLYALSLPAVTGAVCTVTSVGHLAISPLAHIQHSSPATFTSTDASDALHFFTTPSFTKGDINRRGVFTLANGCLPSIDDGSSISTTNTSSATNPYPLRFLYLDPLQTDVRAVHYVHLSECGTRRSDAHTTTPPAQPPTIVDVCSSASIDHTYAHVPYGLLYNPLHQISSIARYAIEGVEASRIRRCVLESIGSIAVRLVEHTRRGGSGDGTRGLTGAQRVAVETQASLLFLSCHSATKDELASYATMMAIDMVRVAEAAGMKSVSSVDRLAQFLRAIPGVDRSHTTTTTEYYTPSTLKSLAISAFKSTDLPTCFYLASAFAFHFCGDHAWWMTTSSSSNGQQELNDTTTTSTNSNSTWVLLQDLITLLGEIMRWYDGRHDCHFAVLCPDESDRTSTRLLTDVSRINHNDESINISLHPADYGVIVKGYRDAYNPFKDLPDALSLISDIRLFEATKRMRPSGDVAATASELYQGLVEDLGGMPFHELGVRIQEPHVATTTTTTPSTSRPAEVPPRPMSPTKSPSNQHSNAQTTTRNIHQHHSPSSSSRGRYDNGGRSSSSKYPSSNQPPPRRHTSQVTTSRAFSDRDATDTTPRISSPPSAVESVGKSAKFTSYRDDDSNEDSDIESGESDWTSF